jgi:hypothetical protein
MIIIKPDDEGIECTVAQIFPNTRKVSLHEIVESHIFLSLCWQLEMLRNTFQGKSSSWRSTFQWNLGE